MKNIETDIVGIAGTSHTATSSGVENGSAPAPAAVSDETQKSPVTSERPQTAPATPATDDSQKADAATASDQPQIKPTEASPAQVTAMSEEQLLQRAHTRKWRMESLERLKNPEPLLFEHDEGSMLSQKGEYPSREIVSFDGGLVRFEKPDQFVSHWFNDWEMSLVHAGWKSLRRECGLGIAQYRWSYGGAAQPEDADFFCPKREMYLALLPSWMPEGMDHVLQELTEDENGHLIIRARNVRKHRFGVFDGDTARGLLSERNTQRCIKMNGLVEFDGVLYVPHATEKDAWVPATNHPLLEVYREYRLNSLRYEKAQRKADREWKKCDDIRCSQLAEHRDWLKANPIA